MVSKLRVEQLETLDGLHTKNVSSLIDDINTAQVTTSTGEQPMSAALDSRIIYVDTIADLQAINTATLVDGQTVNVDGGVFEWRDSESSFIPTTRINATSFGADPSGALDSAQALNDAAEYCRQNNCGMFAERGSVFRIGSPVNLRMIDLEFMGEVVVDYDDDVGVYLGGDANDRGNVPHQRFFKAYRASSNLAFSGPYPAVPTVRLVGLKGCSVTVEKCDYVQLYADNRQSNPNRTHDGSSSYFNIYGDYIQKFSIFGEAGFSWITEGDIYISSIFRVEIDSLDYQHNNIRFHGGTYEVTPIGDPAIDINVGRSITFYDARMEGSPRPRVRFGDRTINCSIIQSWATNLEAADVVITEDLGSGNFITNMRDAFKETYPLIDITPKDNTSTYDVEVENVTGATVDQGVVKVASSTSLYQSRFLRVKSGMQIFSLAEDVQLGGIRTGIKGYDENFNEINVPGASADAFGHLIGDYDYTQDSRPSVNNSTSQFYEIRKGGERAKWIKITIFVPSNLECRRISCYVKYATSYNLESTEDGTVTPVLPEQRYQTQAFRKRHLLGSQVVTSRATQTRVMEQAAPGNPVFVSHDGSLPAGLIVQARCQTAGEVVLEITNTTDSSITIPSGVEVYTMTMMLYQDGGFGVAP